MAETIGELFLEVKLDSSKLYAQFAQVQRDAVSEGKRIEKQVMRAVQGVSGSRATLEPKVDMRQLHDLNKMLDRKQQHIKETQRFLDRNPLKIRVDDSELKAKVGDLKGGTITVRMQAPAQGANTKSGIEQGLESLPGRIGKEVAKAMKPGTAGRIIGAAGGVARGVVSSTLGASVEGIFQGLAQGATEQISKPLGKGLSDALESAISSTLGSSKLLGSSLGERVSKEIGEALEQALPDEIKDRIAAIRNEIVPEQERLLEELSGQGRRRQRREARTPIAREQATFERREALRAYQELGLQQSTLGSRLRQNEAATARGEQVQRAIQQQRDLAGTTGQTELIAEYDKALTEAAAQLEALADEQVQIYEAQREVDQLLKEAKEQIGTTQSRLSDVRPADLPKAYREAILNVAGEEVDERLLPQLIVADERLKAKGAEAQFGIESNTVQVTQEMYSAIAQGNLTLEQMETLYHELQHAVDFAFGQFRGVEARRQGRITTTPVTPTAQEMREIAPLISQYAPEERLSEINAEVLGKRKARVAFTERQAEAQRERLYSVAGFGGTKYERMAKGQLDKVTGTLNELNKLAEGYGIATTDGMAALSETIEQISGEVNGLLDKIAAAEGLDPSQLMALQEALGAQFETLGMLQDSLSEVKRDFVAQVKAAQQLRKEAQAIETEDVWGASVSGTEARSPQDVFRNYLDQQLETLKQSGRTQAGRLQAGAQAAIEDPWGTAAETAKVVGMTAGTVVKGAQKAIEVTQKELTVWNLGIKQVAHDFEVMSNVLKQVHDSTPVQAFLGGVGAATKALGQVTGAAYQLSSGIEDFALDLLPAGKTAKGVLQQTVLPAALFGGATHFLPGGQAAAGMMMEGAQHILGPAGGAIAGDLTSMAGEALSFVPQAFGMQSAVMTGVQGLIDGVTSGAVDALATAGTAILGGKAIQTAAVRALPSALKEGVAQPLQLPFAPISREMEALPATQMKALPAAELKQSSDALVKNTKKYKEAEKRLVENIAKTAEVVEDIPKGIKQARQANPLTLATDIAQKFRDPYKNFKKAFDEGNYELADALAETIVKLKNQAFKDMDAVAKALREEGENVGFGSSLGSKIGNTKSQVSRKANVASRYLQQRRAGVLDVEETSERFAEEELSAERLDLGRSPRGRGRRQATEEQKKAFQELNELFEQAENAADRFDAAFEQVDKTSANAFEEGNKRLMAMAEQIGRGEFLTGLFEKRLGKTGTVLGTIFKGFLAFKGFEIIGGALLNIANQGIQTAVEVERLNTTLSFAEGSTTAAAAQFDRLSDSANDLGVNLRSTVEDYSRLAAAAKGSALQGQAIEQLSQATQEAAAASALSAEQMDRASIALSQIIGKQRVYAEELTGQLSEVGGVYSGSRGLTARALGLDPEELNRQLQRGISAADFIPRFAAQLSAEASLAAEQAADSAIASMNRLENATFSLQASVGEGLLPVEKLRLDVLTAGLKLLEENLGAIARVGGFALTLIGVQLVKAILALVPASTAASLAQLNLATALKTTANFAKTAGPAILKLGAQFLVFSAAIDFVGQLSERSKDLAGDLRDLANSAETNLRKVQELLNPDAGQLAAELPETLRNNLLPGDLEENILFKLFPAEGVRRFENISRAIDNFTLKLITGNEQTFFSKAEKEAQQVAIAIDEILLKNSQLQSEALTLFGTEGQGAGALAQVKQIDEQLRRLNAERRAVTPGDAESRRQLDAQINDLRRAREEPGKAVAAVQVALAKDLEVLEASLERLEELRGRGGITQGEYERLSQQTERALEDTQRRIDQFNGLIRESVDAVTLLGNAFKAVMLALRDANLQAEKQAALGRQGIAQARLGGATPGQVQSLQSQQQQTDLNRQLANNSKAIQELTNLLASSEIQETLQVAGLGPNALPGEIEARALELPEDSRERELLDLAAQYGGELAQLQTDTAALQASILESQADARQAIIDFGRQLDDFYRGIAQQAEDLANETALTQNSAALQNAKSDLRESMLGFSRSFLSGFTDQLMGLLDSLNEATRLDLEADAQIQQALRSLSETGRQARDLGRQAPGGAVGGGETLVGISGNTGIGTGAHLDIRKRGGDRRLTEEELNRFQAGGQSLQSYGLTSEFGSRIHPVTGERRHHGGVDFGIPSGTPITTTVPIRSVKLRDPSQTGGGGWVTDVVFEDGLEVSLLHLDPSTQGANLGVGTRAVQAPRVNATPSQPSMDQRIQAFLDTIAFAEGTAGPQGYQTQFGGGAFEDLSRHPDKVIRAGGYASSAAGRYQFLTPTWDELQQRLGLPDFSPESQDQAAIQLLEDSGALQALKEGNLRGAIAQAAPIWASLPNRQGQSVYGQPVKSFEELESQFNQALGSQAVRIPGDRGPVDLAGARGNVDAQLANIQTQTQAAIREAQVASQEQFQGIRDSFEDAMMTMGDSIRTSARSFEDLRLALPEGPQAELERNLLAITREEEDATRDLRQFIRQLEETAAQSEAGMTEIQNAIAAGRLPLEMGNELLASLQEFSQTSLSELEQAQMRAAEISGLYQAQRDRLQAEFDRAAAERERAFQGRRLGGETELAGLEGERLRRGGVPFDAIRLEQQMARAQELLNFESAIAELEEMHRVGELSADQFETLTRLERELADARLQAIDVTEQAAIQEQRMREQSALFESGAGLTEAIIGRRQGLGLGTGDLERELAIAREQQSLSQGLFDIDQAGYSAEVAERLKEQLIQISEINLQNIEQSFSVMGQILPGLQSSTQGLFSSLISGSQSASEAFEGFFRGLSQQFADLASQLLVNQIFGLFLGGGLPGLGGGIAGGGLFGLGAQKIPKLASGGLITGGVSGQDSVLAALMPGEFVLRPDDVQRFAAMGLLPSYAQGGYAPGSSPVMPRGGGAGGMAGNVTITNNITVNSDGSTDVKTQVQGANQLAKTLDRKIRQVLIEETGPRGILDRAYGR